MNDHGIRDLDQLQEEEARHMPAGVTMLLAGLGGACIVFATLALGGRTSQRETAKSDPLGDLVAHRALAPVGASGRSTTDLAPGEVTFPHMLSDNERPTTALVAVRPAGSEVAVTPSQPPPATDRLPVVPLPAQSVLEATSILTRPRDALTKAATDAAQINAPPPPSSETAPAGHEGGYQLQVSSFHTETEAGNFADQLRARGHKAHVVEAHVPGRGTWFRVRIGPFATQHAATQYRASFEAREHVVPFVVPPETTAKAH